jgi:ABC-type antimicrobial peptide transport system permease subunit
VLATTSIGIAAGLVVAFATSGIMSRLLYEVRPTDAPTYVTSAVVLTLVALLAALIPTLRATRIDPVVTMKAD